MNEFEHQISTMLHDAVPEPPRELRPDQIWEAAPSRRRRTLLLAPLGALAVVLVVTLAIALLSPDRHPSAGPSPGAAQRTTGGTGSVATTDPAALYGVVWTLSAIHRLDGAADTRPDATLPFKFTEHLATGSRDAAIQQGPCGTATARISTGRITFTQQFITIVPTYCGPSLGVAQSHFVFGSVLTGSVTWTVNNGQLTITHAGAGSLDFTHSGQPTPESPQPSTS